MQDATHTLNSSAHSSGDSSDTTSATTSAKHSAAAVAAPSGTSPSSSSRLTALDAVKVFAMIMMMQGHTLDSLARTDQLDINVFPWIIWFHVRGATAPIFLTVSGILFALTMRRSPSGAMDTAQAHQRVRWGGILMLIGYLLVFPASNVLDLPDVRTEGWRLFFQANILQLNAVALSMVTAVALATKTVRGRKLAFFGIAAAILACTPFVNHLSWFSIVPEFLGAFLSYEHGSYFPIFPYAAYMFFGAGIGTLLKEYPKHEHLPALRSIALKTASALALAGLLMLFAEPGMFSFYNELNILQSFPAVVLLREAGVMFLVALFCGVRISNGRTRELIELWGKQSLTIYVIHLLLLFGPPWIQSIGHWYPKALSLALSALIAVVVVTGTLGIVVAIDRLQKNYPLVYARIRTALLLVLTYAVLGWGRIPFVK
jgi:uncharacterized membrane protein